MALIIRNNKGVYVSPPKKLTLDEKKILENTPINKKFIQRATLRKYRIV